MRYHEVSSNAMPYDERYTPYITRIGLLPYFSLVTRSTPNMNPAALTALIDRWRPETHTFHLRTGEMTVTLQDVSMILALPIDGDVVCFSTDSEGWRESMFGLIGKVPPLKVDPTKERNPSGATYVWIKQQFSQCPADANEETILQYARAYVWYVISRSLFADAGGRHAPWMWLKALMGVRRKMSWGSAALAYLYRQVTNVSYFLHLLR